MDTKALRAELTRAADDASLVAATRLGGRPGFWVLPLLLLGPLAAAAHFDLGMLLGVMGGTLAGGLVAGEVVRGRGQRLRLLLSLVALGSPVLLILGVDLLGWVSWEMKPVYLAGAFSAASAIVATYPQRTGRWGFLGLTVIAAIGMGLYGSAAAGARGYGWYIPVHLRTVAYGALLVGLAGLGARRAWFVAGIVAAAVLTWESDLGPRRSPPDALAGVAVLGAVLAGRIAGARIEWDVTDEVRDQASARLAAWCQGRPQVAWTLVGLVAAYLYFALFALHAAPTQFVILGMLPRAYVIHADAPVWVQWAATTLSPLSLHALRVLLPTLVVALAYHATAGRHRLLERASPLLIAGELALVAALALHAFRASLWSPSLSLSLHELVELLALGGVLFAALTGPLLSPVGPRDRWSWVDWLVVIAACVALPLDAAFGLHATGVFSPSIAWIALPVVLVHRLATLPLRRGPLVGGVLVVCVATWALQFRTSTDPFDERWGAVSLLLAAALFLLVVAAAHRARSLTAVPPEHPIYTDFGGPARPEPPAPLDPTEIRRLKIRERRARAGRRSTSDDDPTDDSAPAT